MPRAAAGVQVRGLGQLRRALRQVDKGFDREIGTRLRGVASKAAADAKSNLRSRSKRPRGRIEPTIRAFSRQKSAGIQSTHPGAGVQEWGGTITPRGVPIVIEPKQYMSDAAKARHAEAEREVGELIDDLGGAAGFH